jgi:DNA-binding XRE family transcriptional regulator
MRYEQSEEKRKYFAEKLREMRINWGYSQSGLERAIFGKVSGLIAAWEAKKYCPQIPHQNALIRFFGCKEHDLFMPDSIVGKPVEKHTTKTDDAQLAEKPIEKQVVNIVCCTAPAMPEIMSKEEWIAQRHEAIQDYLLNKLANGLKFQIAIVEEYNETAKAE